MAMKLTVRQLPESVKESLDNLEKQLTDLVKNYKDIFVELYGPPGPEGAPGPQGNKGEGIASIVAHYMNTTINQPPISDHPAWGNTQTVDNQNKYLWIKLTFIFTDGTEIPIISLCAKYIETKSSITEGPMIWTSIQCYREMSGAEGWTNDMFNVNNISEWKEGAIISNLSLVWPNGQNSTMLAMRTQPNGRVDLYDRLVASATPLGIPKAHFCLHLPS